MMARRFLWTKLYPTLRMINWNIFLVSRWCHDSDVKSLRLSIIYMHNVCVVILISDLIVGKPKCFFVQACRGNAPQGTVDFADCIKEVMLDQVVGKISIPTDADLLLTYSTTPGTRIFHNIDFSLQYISVLI